MTVSEKLDFWSQRYNFNIQLWGEYNNHCYITKDDVEIKVIPQGFDFELPRAQFKIRRGL